MRRRPNRCPECLVHQDNCYCALISPIELKTRVSIILFKKERWLPSNTARLSLKSLTNATKFERGHKDIHMPEDFLAEPEYQPLYLYPSEEAIELNQQTILQFKKPINLIVPDGTWRQAKKIHLREKLLNSVPHVKITPTQETRYTLRRQKYEFGVCTHEAIAEALKVIEGEKVYQDLMDRFQVFLDAHHKNRDIFTPIKKKGIHKDPQ